MKREVLAILKEHGKEYVSGAQIADMLGVSRAAVWKTVDSLRKEGCDIHAVTNLGYRLENPNEMIDLDEIKGYLKTEALGQKIEYLKETESTNTIAKERAKQGVPDGYVVLAEKQTAGKGRYGRTFYSPRHGGLYMSIVLRPKWELENIPFLTIMSAVAVCKTLKRIGCSAAGIKWVNDIWIHHKKVCGILTEAEFQVESSQLDYAVIGIGINVFQSALPVDLTEVATSLSEHITRELSVNRIAALILNELEHVYLHEEKEEVIREYRKESIIIGQQIVFDRNGTKTFGLAEEIDDDGALIVKVERDTIVRLHAGEVSIRLRKDC